MTNEEILQYAKENYPVGTKIISVYHRYKSTIDEKGRFEIEDFNDGREARILYYNFQISIPLLIYANNEWAEIISNPEETKTTKMTHEEAIKILNSIAPHSVDSYEYESIKYAINHLKQCEVFDEPVDMELCTQSDFRDVHIGKVYGKLPWGYIVQDVDFDDWLIWQYARPIKKEPLSFGEWFLKNETVSFHNGTVGRINKTYDKYQQYLKDFKDEK